MTNNIAIAATGASGFIGSRLSILSEERGCSFYILNRLLKDGKPNYESSFDSGVGIIVHLAGITEFNPKLHAVDELVESNVESTLRLAKSAANNGVKRFIFLSSIKANDNGFESKDFVTKGADIPECDLYGLSKYKAELGLLEIAKATGMEVVIVRPPLVYGPNVKGNFSSIVKLVTRQIPLPLKLVNSNKRSLIALDNLVDFILLCADYERTPQATNETFVISDGEDVSTAELFERVAKANGKKSRLFPFPQPLLRLGAKLLGKQAMADRLLGSLQVDSSKARELLGWKPVITMNEQLRKMAEADGFASKTD